MKYAKAKVEVIDFDRYEVFMDRSQLPEGDYGATHCYVVQASDEVSSQGYPMIWCYDVTFSTGERKTHATQAWHIVCKSYST